MRAHYEAELWIGAPMWPLGIDAPLPAAGPMCVEFQVAGVFCHHQRFYGLKFVVPNDDRLAVLADSYLASNLPGTWTAEYATPLEDLLQLRDHLQALGLALDPVEYPKFAEAYIPIEGETAWRYAIDADFAVATQADWKHAETREARHEIGLGREWPDCEEYLAADWRALEEKYSPAHRPWQPNRWTAVLHYPNSD